MTERTYRRKLVEFPRFLVDVGLILLGICLGVLSVERKGRQ